MCKRDRAAAFLVAPLLPHAIDEHDALGDLRQTLGCVDGLRKQEVELPAERTKVAPPQWGAPPTGSDADLARLLNLWRPPVDYPTGSASHRCRSTAAGRSTRLIAVGGSFLDQILDPIAACALFGRVDSYFYYDLGRFDWMVRRRYPVHRAIIKWRDELDHPTVLLVAMNERLLSQGVPSYLDRFLDDPRAALR